MPTQLDHFVTLGRSGLRVSPLCLGAMTFGEEWEIGSNREESAAVLQAYLDAGGNFIDTANIYNKGQSEHILGEFFAGKSAKGQAGASFAMRDRVVIATKWMGNMFPGDPNAGGGHRKGILMNVEDSLRRMRTDYIDLYWMHFWDRTTPIEETMRTLENLVQSGKVRYIGFSDTPAWKCAQAQMIAEFRGWEPLIALQIEYSLVQRTVEGELMPMAAELGMGVTPWSPLAAGFLTGKYARDAEVADTGRARWAKGRMTEKNWAILDAVQAIGVRIGQSAAGVSLAWLRQQAGVTSTIIGARTLGQLEANIASLSFDLDEEALATLGEVSRPELDFPHDFLQMVRRQIHSGCVVDGFQGDTSPLSPDEDAQRW